jgi:hypothetical protein
MALFMRNCPFIDSIAVSAASNDSYATNPYPFDCPVVGFRATWGTPSKTNHASIIYPSSRQATHVGMYFGRLHQRPKCAERVVQHPFIHVGVQITNKQVRADVDLFSIGRRLMMMMMMW